MARGESLVTAEPQFIPDPGVSDEVGRAFSMLSALVLHNPENTLPIFNTASHGDIIKAAGALDQSDASMSAGSLRLAAYIFENGFDFDVGFDPITEEAMRAVRESGSEVGARMRRIGTFVRHLHTWHAQRESVFQKNAV